MTIRKELQLLLICSASLLSTYTFADKPTDNSADLSQVATESREKAEHKARIEEHRALAEGKRAASSREGSDDSSDDDDANAEEQPEKAEG